MPSYLQKQSKRGSREPSAVLPLIRSWTERRKLEFSNLRRPNSYVTSGMYSKTNRHRLGREAAALPSSAVRLAASVSIHLTDSFGISLMTCSLLFCRRLLRSPARNKIISSFRVSSVLVLYIASSCPAALRRRFAWPELSRHRRY